MTVVCPVPERGRQRSPRSSSALPEIGDGDGAHLRRGRLDATTRARRSSGRSSAPGARHLAARADRHGQGRRRPHRLRARQARRADDPRRRPERRARGPAEVLRRVSPRARGEFVNGSRLVYDLEPGAMRFLNMLGNKFFSLVFKAIIGPAREGHALRDEGAAPRRLRARSPTAGVLRRLRSVRRLRPPPRRGAPQPEDRRPARALPARGRTATTNISRFRHGLLLLRMTAFAFWKFQCAAYRL